MWELGSTKKVLRCLFALVQRECGQCKRSGGLLVVVRALRESPATLTVSAAGPWCKKLSKPALNEALERLSLQVTPCGSVQEELQTFIDNFGCLFFSFSCYVGNTSQSIEAEQTKIQRFLHRLSLVNAQVKIIFEIKADSVTHKQIFSGEKSKVSVMDYNISMDTAAYRQSLLSKWSLRSCPEMHQELGDPLSFVLPTDTIEAGLYGEMSVVTMAMLAPCMDQYANWPTHLSCIRILVYSPCGLPLMQQTQMSFLQSLATSLSWADLGFSKVCCKESQNIQGSLCSDVEFSVEIKRSQETQCWDAVQQNNEPECSHAVEQTLTVFIFAQYTDPFRSQITDFMSSEEVFERHLDAVLWYNEDQLRATLQSTMKKTLKKFQKRHAGRQRLNCTIPIVLSSVNSIIAGSSNGEFRTACVDSMRVKSTCELQTSLRQSFQSIVDGRFTPRAKCRKEKRVAQAVRSQKRSPDILEEAFENPRSLSSKRIHCDLESSSFISEKRQCTEPFSEDSDTNEATNIQKSPLSPVHLPQIQQTRTTADKSSAPSLTKLINEQVEEQWLQELENFSEWD
ncbi:DUF4554 domain-containing protein [Danio aesculapii]|uniref:DUF4554 domain-containing protein n=1 Tax=Danio aesculapii TaxID=1142201 RepID=UPI0024C0D15D|nr:DUF4554 domain-containing protein [Danio aesculapii]